jgi:Tol biopolymer transport system component
VYAYRSFGDWIDRAYLWDRATGERIAIGRYYPGSTGWLRASDDGGVVVYQTNRVMRWDRATGVSTALTSEVGYWPVPSSDGRFVVFEAGPLELSGVPRPGTYFNLAIYDATTGSTSWAGPSGGPYHRMTADASMIVTADWRDEGIGILRRIG